MAMFAEQSEHIVFNFLVYARTTSGDHVSESEVALMVAAGLHGSHCEVKSSWKVFHGSASDLLAQGIYLLRSEKK